MTSYEWKALKVVQEHLKGHYPGAEFNFKMTRQMFDELVGAFEDLLATGDVRLRDERLDEAPSEGRSLAEELEWADKVQRTLK